MEYPKDWNRAAAAVRAGYSKKTASVQGWQLLRKPHVALALAQYLNEREERIAVETDEIVAELCKIAFVDPRRFFRPNGTLKEIPEMDEYAAAAVAGFTQRTTVDKEGNMTIRTDIKFADKKGALELLGKHKQMFAEKLVHDINLNERVFFVPAFQYNNAKDAANEILDSDSDGGNGKYRGLIGQG